MNEEKALARVKREMNYRNEYNKENYDRVNCLLAKGTKERIKSSGDTLNNFIKQAILEKLEREGL